MLIKLTEIEYSKYYGCKNYGVYATVAFEKAISKDLFIFEYCSDSKLYKIKEDVPLEKLKIIEEMHDFDFSNSFLINCKIFTIKKY